jgi:hypothetical protein
MLGRVGDQASLSDSLGLKQEGDLVLGVRQALEDRRRGPGRQQEGGNAQPRRQRKPEMPAGIPFERPQRGFGADGRIRSR